MNVSVFLSILPCLNPEALLLLSKKKKKLFVGNNKGYLQLLLEFMRKQKICHFFAPRQTTFTTQHNVKQ